MSAFPEKVIGTAKGSYSGNAPNVCLLSFFRLKKEPSANCGQETGRFSHRAKNP